ncbi:MAG: GGDEF domain-containing protein, partial [Pseudothermotoga sp.]
EGAENVLERIRNKLKQKNNLNFPVDISYGFAKFVTRDEYKTAFDKADESLYRMKDHKRI